MTKTKNKQRQRQLIENKDKERQIRQISQPQAFQAGYGLFNLYAWNMN